MQPEMLDRLIAHYRTTARLGAGGMGEVYRATDSRLGREVALKVLRADLAGDASSLARFEREARILAGLQHRNIAVVHGFEDHEGVRALVMELVEGPTLADRVAQGRVPVDEALGLAQQVAEALEYAHERGIVHRDLKPANVKLTPEGEVKVLDFGLAKALEGERPQSDSGDSPTLTAGATAAGVILGTAAYMSPEQARGRAVDRRTDVWAFGCLVFELLAGRRAFGGDTVTDTLATILGGEPDWDALPADTPRALRLLIARCLDKDARRRLQAIGEARLQIEDLRQLGNTARLAHTASHRPAADLAEPGPARRPVRGLVAAALFGLSLGAGATWLLRPAPRPAVSWLSLDLRPAEGLAEARPRHQAFALAPDGQNVVFSGQRDGSVDLYLRALDQREATVIPGTRGATNPAFSQDGRWIAFVADEAVKKVAVAGGPVARILDLDTLGANEPGSLPGQAYGLDWDGPEHLLVGRFADGLWRIDAASGVAQRLTTVGSGAFAHRLPHALPGGRGFVFTLCRDRGGESDVAVLGADGTPRVLVQDASDGRVLSDGRLLFVRDGVLNAVPFDRDRLELAGTPVPVAENVMHAVGASPSRSSGAAQLTVSASGSLLFARGGAQGLARSRPMWLDGAGRLEALPLPAGHYAGVRIAPGPGRVAFGQAREDRRDRTRIFVLDLAQGALSGVPGEGFSSPIWSPDGQRLYFRGSNPPGLYAARADGAESPKLVSPGQSPLPGSLTPDGTQLVYADRARETGWDLWVLSLAAPPPQPKVLLQTVASERQPRLSPDGRWLAYVSNGSGRNEVYVQPFPGPGTRTQVSLQGGQAPFWSADGRALNFVSEERPQHLMTAVVVAATGQIAGPPRETPGDLSLAGAYLGYDASPKDGRLLVLAEQDEPEPPVAYLQLVSNAPGS